ncbi:protein-glutamate O-methyltransferase CheR [Terrimonas sp. NA20]|uniref:Protein-glutamate O-methyltransferase CheR n=1 Tax=Terrimonas ginsenosidimutans TaxID=2908004 RepID=A0ABS9KXY1_9BACT|nr:protein-glutamate O-methyltransferase CheR [Terrimonas ginsenosidimutans]MCG2617175.1 protein-glutamate O-methyltransferase CheR [Terrimonas ginsenosidimutans]
MDKPSDIQITEEDLTLLINDIHLTHGYDFSDYSRASFRRRIERLITIDQLSSFAELRYRVRTDPAYFAHVVEEISVTVTEMLRDPAFYKIVRNNIIPVLATYPFIKVWHAGCATGEEVYSMAILLKEAGLLHKSLLYATDMNPAALAKARKGIFPLSQMQQYSRNYMLAGGTQDFSSYYTANYHFASFDSRLSEKIIFAQHNLVTDFSFNSFQLIFCRNVLIYFNKDLQNRVLKLFDDSLEFNGFLALGTKENIRFSSIAPNYKQIIGREKIWRKIK